MRRVFLVVTAARRTHVGGILVWAIAQQHALSKRRAVSP
jgi:hypothetical protein